MPDFLQNAGRELPFILLLLALLGLRWRVTPRVSLFINAPMEAIFPQLDFREGEEQRWQRTRVKCQVVDEDSQTYQLTFVTALATGAVQTSTAQFRIERREPPHLIDIRRAGLDGQSHNNQLLRMLSRAAYQLAIVERNIATQAARHFQ